jgi:hypothetical protein
MPGNNTTGNIQIEMIRGTGINRIADRIGDINRDYGAGINVNAH